MRIIKQQLRRIIRESSEWEFRRNRWDKFKQHMAREPEIYLDWVEKNGHVTPASASVMATYFLEMGLEREHKIQKKLASEIGLDHEDVMRDMKRQKNEQAVMMGESRMKLTKRQLRRIIKEAAKSKPCPDRYDWEKLLHVASEMLVGRYYEGAGQGFMKVWNRYRKSMGLPEAYYDLEPESMKLVMRIGARRNYNLGAELSDEDLQALCDAWQIDVEEYDMW